jgi:hypothetical protein
MGHAIHYCTGCSIQLRDPDFEKGVAFRSEARVYCKNCVPDAVRQRPQQTDRVGSNTSKVPRVTPPPNPTVLPPEPASGFPKWALAAGGALVIVILVVAMAMSPHEPSRRPAESSTPIVGTAPVPPPPTPPPPPPARNEKAAEDAVRKAREFAQASPEDFIGQLTQYEAAIRASEETGHHAAALRERDAVLSRQKTVVKTQLDALDATLRAACEREEFGAALKRIDEARVRPLGGDWPTELGKRAQDVADAADKLFAAVRKDAADAQKRGADEDVKRQTERIARWEIERFKSELAKAVASAVPKKPPPPPAPAKAIDAYRKKWTEAMAAASFRDFAGALKKIEDAKVATTDPTVQVEGNVDLEFFRQALSAEEEALQLIPKIPKGTRLTVTCMTEAGSKVEMTGTVVRNENFELELAREKGNARIPFGEISSRTLGLLLKGKREDKGAAVLCIIDGDAEGAKGLIEGAAAIPDKYWAFKAPPNPPGQAAARKMFYAAERESRSHARSADALQKYATLLKDHATTEFVRRNKAIIAARAEGSKEFYFVFEDIRIGGAFKAFKGGDDLYWRSMAQADPAKPGVNYVEISFPALADVEYRCWFYVGGCCTEAVSCSYQVSESAEPGSEATLPVKQLPSMTYKTHASHEGRGRPAPRWGWIQLPLSKFASAGAKKVRLLAADKGFCAAQALVSATRQGTPTASESKELERIRLEARGGRADAGLIGHWKLADGSGTVVADSSPSGVDGELVKGAAWAPATASSPPALKLDGTGWINLGKDLNLLQGVSAVSMAAWVCPDKLPGEGIHAQILALSKNTGGAPTVDSRASLMLSSGGLLTAGGRALDTDPVNTVKSTEKLVKAGAWTHVAATIDYAANSITLYVNGNPIPGTGTVKFGQKATATTPCTMGAIGADDNGAAGFFTGKLSDIRLYARLLSPEEIAELAASPNAHR